ncbi:MAG: hypothetical protein ACRDD1_20905 [Planctomycetia bacterium]
MSTSLVRPVPKAYQQQADCSCWATVLQSWSQVEPRFQMCLDEGALSTQYGEGVDRGITPETKIPLIANRFNLGWGGFRGSDLKDYLEKHLGNSHIFCSYVSMVGYQHAVLIYKYSGGKVSYMDPDGAQLRRKSLSWIENRGPLVLMRRK